MIFPGKTIPTIAAALALSHFACAQSRIGVYTSEGFEPVEIRGGKLPKNSSETYYLATPGQAAKPKQAPKPPKEKKPRAPKPPKAKPAPKPVPTPTIQITKKAAPRPEAPAAGGEFDDLDEYGDIPTVADPIEPVNRGLFWFNHQLYNYIARPVSKAYTTVFPKPVRKAIGNVYKNAEYPVRLTNDLLQLDFKNADLETRKFLLNSTAGVGGILKVSDRFPSLANVPPADTGETLGKWGVPHGPYIVLPVVGPRTARDTVGFAGDIALNPVTWVGIAVGAPAIALPITTPNSVNNAHTRLEIYDAATKDSIDPYIAARSSYIQYREKNKKPAQPAAP